MQATPSIHGAGSQAAGAQPRKQQLGCGTPLRVCIPHRMRSGISQEQGQMAAWEQGKVIQSHRSQPLLRQESVQGIHRDGKVNKVLGDGDAFGSCIFHQPVGLVLTWAAGTRGFQFP